jgi:hypothetical protein
MGVQFTVIPSFEKVADYFQRFTGKSMILGTYWSVWHEIDSEQYDVLRQYYRPCHIRVLEDTIAKKYENACVLLRQLLRPHGYKIEKSGASWTLQEISAGSKQKGVSTKEGTTVIWNED